MKKGYKKDRVKIFRGMRQSSLPITSVQCPNTIKREKKTRKRLINNNIEQQTNQEKRPCRSFG